MRKQLNARELFHFCEQFSLILHSGISSTEGLHMLIEDAENDEVKKILVSITDDFETNGFLSESLEHSGLFPSSMIAYVKVGEETGCLDEIMENLAAHYQQEIEVTEHIRHAVAYPLMMLGMMAAVIIILLVKVMPVFQQVFRQMGLEMNELSYGLLKISAMVSRYSHLFFILLCALLVLLLFFGCHPKGRQLLYRMISKLPFLREIPVSLDYGRLTQGVSLGIRSGLDPITSLELADSLIIHPQVKEHLQKALVLLNEGNSFISALTDSDLFHGMDARLISIGFQAGAADEVMKKISDRYHEKSISTLERVISVIEPTIVIFLSIMVGVVLLSVMMPLLGILSDMII